MSGWRVWLSKASRQSFSSPRSCVRSVSFWRLKTELLPTVSWHRNGTENWANEEDLTMRWVFRLTWAMKRFMMKLFFLILSPKKSCPCLIRTPFFSSSSFNRFQVFFFFFFFKAEHNGTWFASSFSIPKWIWSLNLPGIYKGGQKWWKFTGHLPFFMPFYVRVCVITFFYYYMVQALVIFNRNLDCNTVFIISGKHFVMQQSCIFQLEWCFFFFVVYLFLFCLWLS